MKSHHIDKAIIFTPDPQKNGSHLVLSYAKNILPCEEDLQSGEKEGLRDN